MDIFDLALSMTKGIGSKTAIHLLDCFGSAEGIFSASRDDLQCVAKLNSTISDAILRRDSFSISEREILFASKNGINIISATDSEYPPLLKECNDYPHILYVKGSVDALHKRSLSVVGTRRASEYGRKVCGRIIDDLSHITRDITIVSGLALGIDGCAHRSALASGLSTVAVLPCPLHVVAPVEHQMLSNEILNQGGCLVSEYHSSSVTKSYGFVARNRIIAGLSDGTLVVESPYNGGSLLTAGMADGYSRSVMAIPGRIFDSSSKGSNNIIKSMQAKLISSASDIISELGWSNMPTHSVEADDLVVLTKESQEVLSLIREGETISIDSLISLSGLSSTELASIILELEFDGHIKRLPGNIYER